MNTRFTTALLLALLGADAAVLARLTPTGTAFTYQGQLKQGGNNVNATADFEFRLFDVPAGGTIIGSMVPANGVTMSDGLFTVDIDFGAAAFGTEARWLDISVRSPAGSGLFTPLVPRQQVRPAPLAQFALGVDGPNITNLNASNIASGTIADSRLSSNVGLLNGAQTFTGAKTFSAAPSFTSVGAPFSVTNPTLVTSLNADLLDGLNASAFLTAVPNPLSLSGSTGTGPIIKGSNTGTGPAVMGVQGEITSTSATGNSYGGFFTNVDDLGIGVFGRAQGVSGQAVYGQANSSTGANYGGYFTTSSTSGTGVFGLANATTGTNYGVRGQSDSTNGRAVFGTATSTTGFSYGGRFEIASNQGAAVYGLTTSATNTGSYAGQFESAAAHGVLGAANAATGTTYGGRFQSSSTSGRGVYASAFALSGTTYGGFFQSDSTSGKGVHGFAANSSGVNMGVHGQSVSAAGFGVFSTGNTGATGTKGFRIDHPDDPEHKYLMHYSAESPEVINFYSGKATLDSAGQAVVELPHYFAKVNKDPRYTLTAVGAAMPNLHVADEIDDHSLNIGAVAEPGQVAPMCWFRIAGGAPGMKVSWEVKALRNDRWVQQRGAPVEIEKQDIEKGTYQHPELYGQPPEKGMNYDATHEQDSPKTNPSVSSRQ